MNTNLKSLRSEQSPKLPLNCTLETALNLNSHNPFRQLPNELFIKQIEKKALKMENTTLACNVVQCCS